MIVLQFQDKSILKNTLKIAAPAVAESLFVGLVGMVDTMMVGNLGPAAIAAVGLTTQPKFMGLAIFISFNASASAVVARRYGENNQKDANSILFNGLLLVTAATALISTIFVVFSYPIASFMQGDEETTKLASDYLKIIMGGLFFYTVTYFINACQRGIGNTKITFKTNAATNIVNVIFNYFLIEGKMGFPALGVKGAAIATVIGTVVGFMMAVGSVIRKNCFISLLYRSEPGFTLLTRKSLLKIWTSALSEQLFMRFGFLIFTLTVSSLGTNAYAANQIGMNIIQLSFALGDGLSTGVLALVGKSMGEKDVPLAEKYVKCCLNLGHTATMITSFIFIFGGRALFMLFTDDSEVLSYARFITFILALATLLQIPTLVYTGALRGAGDSLFTAVLCLVSIAVIRPFSGWFLTYPVGWGLRGAWIGFLIDHVTRFILSSVRYKTGKWKNIKI